MRRWHPNIHDHQLGRLLPDQRDQLLPTTGLPHHRETRPLQQAGQTLPQQDVVLSEDHPQPAHGRNITVPTGTRLRGFPLDHHDQDYPASHPP